MRGFWRECGDLEAYHALGKWKRIFLSTSIHNFLRRQHASCFHGTVVWKGSCRSSFSNRVSYLTKNPGARLPVNLADFTTKMPSLSFYWPNLLKRLLGRQPLTLKALRMWQNWGSLTTPPGKAIKETLKVTSMMTSSGHVSSALSWAWKWTADIGR